VLVLSITLINTCAYIAMNRFMRRYR
jgi:hypothetical protein